MVMLTEPTLSPHNPLAPPECLAPHGESSCWCLPRCQRTSLDTNYNNGELHFWQISLASHTSSLQYSYFSLFSAHKAWLKYQKPSHYARINLYYLSSSRQYRDQFSISLLPKKQRTSLLAIPVWIGPIASPLCVPYRTFARSSC